MKKFTLLLMNLLLILCVNANAQKRNEVTWEKIEDVTVPIPPRKYTPGFMYARRIYRS
ncbi:MAG: hypothetical protein LUE99_00460 [Bacteroides sp.]|nr:hypothetical protein [Bacteroides sp.]